MLDGIYILLFSPSLKSTVFTLPYHTAVKPILYPVCCLQNARDGQADCGGPGGRVTREARRTGLPGILTFGEIGGGGGMSHHCTGV